MNLKKLILIIVSTALLWCNTVYASDQELSYIYYEEANTASEAMQLFTQGMGRKVKNPYFSVGNSEGKYWLQLSFCHPREASNRFVINTGVTHRPQIEIYLFLQSTNITEPHGRLILGSDGNMEFPDRKTKHRLLVSNSFLLRPNHCGAAIIDYHHIGASYLKPTLMSLEKWQKQQIKDTAFAALFYGCSLLLIILFAGFGILFNDRFTFAYSSLFALGLFWLFSLDGWAFQYLWPASPRWNHWASFVLLYGFVVCNLLIAAWVSRNVIILSTAFVGVLLGISAIALPFSLLANLGGALLVFSFAAQFWVLATRLPSGLSLNSITLGLLGVLVITLLILLLVTWTGTSIPHTWFQYSGHFTYTLCSLAAMFANGNHILSMRKQTEATLKRELQSAKAEAHLQKSLADAERNYQQAANLAKLHRQQLASASHDIRQPLIALRATLAAATRSGADGVAGGMNGVLDSDVRANMENALDYIDSLSQQYLQTSHPHNEEINAHPINDAQPQHFCIEDVVASAIKMFSDDAQRKNIKLRASRCSLEVSQQPLVLMRIISNLVSNAINHGNAGGKILIGCRRRSNAIEIQILDNGPGIDKNQLKTLFDPYRKGKDSQGEGLGLALCQNFAEEQGWQLTVTSQPGRGTCFSLSLPKSE